MEFVITLETVEHEMIISVATKTDYDDGYNASLGSALGDEFIALMDDLGFSEMMDGTYECDDEGLQELFKVVKVKNTFNDKDGRVCYLIEV